MKKLTSLNSSENLKLGACAPAIILIEGFMQDQDTSQVLLYSKIIYSAMSAQPKRTGKGTSKSLQAA